MPKRLVFLIVIFSLLFLGITSKAFYEQIIMGPTYAIKSLEIRTKQFPAEEYIRGDILDRNGISLTDAAFRPTIILFPKLITNVDKLLEKIRAEIPQLNINAKEIKPQYRNGKKIYPEPFIIRVGEDNDILIKISSWNEPGLVVLPYKTRYGNNSLAVHLIGYMGYKNHSYEPQGMMGIEAKFEEILKGDRPEKIITPITDARNNILEGLGYRILDLGRDEQRSDVILSIDSRIQKIVEQVMDEKGIIKGGVVVLDIDSGQILAGASRPIYDQNDLDNTMGFDDNQVERIIDYKVYPGSIFKILTAVAALEEGIVTPETKFYCTGSSPDFRVKCPRAHGELTFSEAMEQSCNVTFVQVGLSLGREKLEKYIIEKFGIHPIKNKSLDSPEARAHGIIGQVIFEVSPLEMANIIATVARDGYHQELLDPWKTRLVKAVKTGDKIENYAEIPKYSQLYSKNTAQQLKAILTATNQRGSGKKAWIEGYGSAGKTGTPQVNGLGEYMAWYTGYAPLDKPKYAVAVLIEKIDGLNESDLQGGTHAGPVFKEIIERIIKLEER
jgi:cell division protein FtsI/penicillin-binding protein 2